MRLINLLAACAALMAMLNLSGCALRGEGPYTYDRGDRVDRNGNRDVGWCNVHTSDAHCRVETAEAPQTAHST